MRAVSKKTRHMTLITPSQLAALAKVKTRQVQRILDRGTPDLGASRTPGGHWVIPDTPEIRKWAKNHRRWKRVRHAITPPDPVDDNVVTHHENGKLSWRDGVTIGEWRKAHVRLMPRKRRFTAWRKASVKYAIARWGIEVVADAVVQMEMDLGIEMKEKPVDINAPDKSKAIINIHGISLGFDIWHRKMRDEIETWGADKLDLAIEMLGHQARVHAELVAKRQALTKRKS
jgi:hypothetical protein